MKNPIKSIRPFIGAKDYKISRSFYKELGFEEVVLTPTLSCFKWGNFAFYLQDAYVKDWIDNTMIFMEVHHVEDVYQSWLAIHLPTKYKKVRLLPIRQMDWGKECFLHDPSGILWHIGEFNDA
ncbi:glyoxalase [Flavobacterium sp.]|uniref:glyoxalase n=1 Tax=Flavobacterium sp. TaxID=239 RepID=UPI002FDD9BE0